MVSRVTQTICPRYAVSRAGPATAMGYACLQQISLAHHSSGDLVQTLHGIRLAVGGIAIIVSHFRCDGRPENCHLLMLSVRHRFWCIKLRRRVGMLLGHKRRRLQLFPNQSLLWCRYHNHQSSLDRCSCCNFQFPSFNGDFSIDNETNIGPVNSSTNISEIVIGPEIRRRSRRGYRHRRDGGATDWRRDILRSKKTQQNQS